MRILFKLFSRSIGGISYFADHVPNRHLKNKIVLSASYEVDIDENEKCCLLKTEEIYGSYYRYSHKYFQKEAFLSLHKNIVFLGNSGAIVEKNSAVVVESVFDELRMVKSPAFRIPSILFSKNKKGVFTTIMHLPWAKANIYHWFIDCLPRFFSIKQIPYKGKINLIAPEELKPFQEETLQFFLDQDERLQIVRIKETEKWDVEQFWLPSFVSNHLSGFMPEGYLNYVRSTVLQGYKIGTVINKKKIYISRKDALKRRIVNEEDLVLLLREKGYEIIQAEKLNFQEQTTLFASASEIISCHGAGLTHMLFASKCKIIEIQPENVVKSHYCLLSKACGHEYHSFISGIANHNFDFSIDLEGLRKLIQD